MDHIFPATLFDVCDRWNSAINKFVATCRSRVYAYDLRTYSSKQKVVYKVKTIEEQCNFIKFYQIYHPFDSSGIKAINKYDT